MNNLNHKYWEEMTVKSTLSYCKEMLRLSGNPYEKVSEEDFDQRCEAYVRKVIEYDREKTLKNHLSELYELSPFPNDIRGYLHEYGRDGIFQPKHLMCKIATIRVQDITFEFLVEYGILESEVEIYYGIKAISDNTKTTEDFATKVMALSDRWFEYIRGENKNRGKSPIDCKQHKFTNNVHDGTFWISWVRMESKDKMQAIVNNLSKRIQANFRIFLLNKAGEPWQDIQEETTWVSDIRAILNNKPSEDKRQLEYPGLIEILEAACKYKDRNTEHGETILQKLGRRYQFKCESFKAMVFLELLYNPVHFYNTYKQALKFWDEYSQQERNSYRNFRNFIIQRSDSVEIQGKHWYAQDKRDFDRLWIQDTFRDQNGDMFLDTFFNRRVQFDNEREFKKIKEVLEFKKIKEVLNICR